MSTTHPCGSVAIGPSILSADFLVLGQQLREIEEAGASYVHVDVMDGRFVPNISIGLPVMDAVKRGTSLPLDVHLMIVEPDRWVDAFCEAGADVLTFHAEAAPHMHRVAQQIVERGVKAGVAINPATPLASIEELLPFVDQVLVMTVNPGFGGQSFIESMVDKVTRLRRRLDEVHPSCVIQVDGGINATTAPSIVAAGASSLVAGTAIINAQRSIAANMERLREAISGQPAG